MRWVRQNVVALLALFIALGQPALADGFGAGFQFVRGLFGDGSASAPSISFSGDTDTGIFLPGSNVLGFATAGSERGRVDGNGTFHLGDTSSLTEVPAAYFARSSEFGQLQLGNASGTSYYIGRDNVSTGNLVIGPVANSSSAAGTRFFAFSSTGVPTFAGPNTSGAGSALLGSNSPATTNSAPFVWITAAASDGSTVYIPAWK